MKTHELRLGNIVNGVYYCDEKEDHLIHECKILGLDSVGFSEYKVWVEALQGNNSVEQYDGFTGIFLNPEWLCRFGYREKRGVYEIYNYFFLQWYNNRYHLGFNQMFTGVDLVYVHQFQNLVYSLTGKDPELTG